MNVFHIIRAIPKTVTVEGYVKNIFCQARFIRWNPTLHEQTSSSCCSLVPHTNTPMPPILWNRFEGFSQSTKLKGGEDEKVLLYKQSPFQSLIPTTGYHCIGCNVFEKCWCECFSETKKIALVEKSFLYLYCFEGGKIFPVVFKWESH